MSSALITDSRGELDGDVGRDLPDSTIRSIIARIISNDNFPVYVWIKMRV